jgi:hypothetical protein
VTKLHGDVTEKDKLLAEELESFEKFLTTYENMPPNKGARMAVCLAHDWYQLGCEEDGARLLKLASKFAPDYFKEQIKTDAAEDPLFNRVVRNIAVELSYLLLANIEDSKLKKE